MLKVLLEIDLLKLKSERMRRMLSQQDVAEVLGISRGYFQYKEIGRSHFEEEELEKLLKLYGLKKKEILK